MILLPYQGHEFNHPSEVYAKMFFNWLQEHLPPEIYLEIIPHPRGVTQKPDMQLRYWRPEMPENMNGPYVMDIEIKSTHNWAENLNDLGEFVQGTQRALLIMEIRTWDKTRPGLLQPTQILHPARDEFRGTMIKQPIVYPFARLINICEMNGGDHWTKDPTYSFQLHPRNDLWSFEFVPVKKEIREEMYKSIYHEFQQWLESQQTNLI